MFQKTSPYSVIPRPEHAGGTVRRRGRSTHIDLSVLANNARQTTHVVRAQRRTAINNCGTPARGSSGFNSMNCCTAHKINKSLKFLSVLLYRKVLESDRNLLATIAPKARLQVRVDGGPNDVFLPQSITFVPFIALPTCTSTHFRAYDVLCYG